MKLYSRLFIALIFSTFTFLAEAAVIVPGGNIVPTVSMAGVTIPVSQAIILTANTSTGSNYDALRQNGSAYQVPTGYKLVIIAQRAISGPSGSAVGIALYYGDTAVANNSSAPTNSVSKGAGGNVNIPAQTTGSFGASTEHACYVEIPAGKYPHMRSTGADVYGHFLGYLVKV